MSPQLHPQPPSIVNMQTPSTLLLQQHDMNPSMQQQMQQAHQKEAEQLQQSPLESVLSQPHKQTLQEAHAEAQLHFQHARAETASPVLLSPVAPAGTGIYSMVNTYERGCCRIFPRVIACFNILA